MAAYLGYLILAGVQALFFYRRDNMGKKQFDARAYLFLSCIEIILLSGLRGYTVGADTVVYLDALRHYKTLPLWEIPLAPLVYPFDFEVGYFALTKLCAFLGMNESVFLLVIAIATYIPVYKTIKIRSTIPYLSILCYFAFGMFSYSLGVFRQMIAISILLCGWRYIRERKPVKYLIVVGIAMTFHLTAVIALFLYVLYHIKWKNVIVFVLPAELVLLVSGRPLVILATKIFPQYTHYLGGKYDLQGGSYLMLLLLNVVLLVCIILEKKGKFSDDVTMCALILSVLFQAVGYSMALFGRIVPYFSIYLIFAIPNIVYGMGKHWRKPVGILIIMVLFSLTYWLMNGNQYVTPYYLFFQDIPIK